MCAIIRSELFAEYQKLHAAIANSEQSTREQRVEVAVDTSGENFVRMLARFEPLAAASAALSAERDAFSRQFLELSTALQTTRAAVEQRGDRLGRKQAQIAALRAEIVQRSALIGALRENK